MSVPGSLFREPDQPPVEEGSPVFCHQEFLYQLQQYRQTNIGKRAALLMQRLVVDARRTHFKSTKGVNQGWRRSRLGGTSGSHFYAWWAPKGAPPLKDAGGFDLARDGAIFLRAIRHHDDHSPLTPQSLDDHYLPVSVGEMRGEDYAPSPLTAPQSKFVSGRERVRIIKGYPGSGKTTALWYAADENTHSHGLYITFSKDLAALARDYFRRYGPGNKHFRVITWPLFVREVTGSTAEQLTEPQMRERFVKEISSFSPRILGPWADDRRALYDEIHAHLIGDALPASLGRFTGCNAPRVPDRDYRERRRRFVGGAAADALLEIANTIERRQTGELTRRLFPELQLAWDAAQSLSFVKSVSKFGEFDCIAVDESQDLTPIESFALVQLAAGIRRERGSLPRLLIAGDEAQTVRPTDFEWGWFQDLIHYGLAKPEEHKLSANLRSPRRIALLIRAVWDLYTSVSKHDRPSGSRDVDIEEDSADQLIYCAAPRGDDLDSLLVALAAREGWAIINLEQEIPAFVPAAARHAVLSVFEAKGLDFQSVCLLNPGRSLRNILHENPYERRSQPVEPLNKRLAIDQLRVAVSRPTERLVFLDVDPAAQEGEASIRFLRAAERDISAVIPQVVLKTLEEEQLDAVERVKLCEADARQFLEVKPELSWTRAKQAISLLSGVQDQEVTRSAHATLAQVACCLALRGVQLPKELGIVPLWTEAVSHALDAGKRGLAEVIHHLSLVDREPNAAFAVTVCFQQLEVHHASVESWLWLEITSRKPHWIEVLEAAAVDPANGLKVLEVLPRAYATYGISGTEERLARFRKTNIDNLIKAKQYRAALEYLSREKEPDLKRMVRCIEGLGDFSGAAPIYERLEMPEDALRCWRSVPDLDRALKLIGTMESHPAAESLAWLAETRKTLARKPENFARVATKAEKELYESLLRGEGVEKKKRAPAKKPAQPKPPAPTRKPKKPTPFF